MTTWEKIKNWWLFSGCELLNFHRFRSFRRGLCNLFVWFPTIWYDRQWDDYYLYNMLRVKFRRMEEFYGESKWAISADADKVAHQCRICRILCERIIAEDYTTPYTDRVKPIHDRFWKQFKDFMGSPEDKPFERKLTILEYNHENMMLKQDIKYLCHMINKHSQGWWD